MRIGAIGNDRDRDWSTLALAFLWMSSSVRLSAEEAEVLASLMMPAISELLLSISRVKARPLVSIACRLSLVTRSMSVANCMPLLAKVLRNPLLFSSRMRESSALR